jgi:hypothetical protein
MSRSCTSLPPSASMTCGGTALHSYTAGGMSKTELWTEYYELSEFHVLMPETFVELTEQDLSVQN